MAPRVRSATGRRGWCRGGGSAAHSALLMLGAAALVAAAVAPGVAGQASRERYLVERSGQDTLVRRAADGEVVYTTSVADTSEGSDTDEDLTGGEEFFHGCLWTFRQKLGICEGGNCDDAEILAHDLQRRLIGFYRDRRFPAAPPLEEAAWLAIATRSEERRELFESCPGLIVSTLLFVAEALVFSGAREAEAYAHEAQSYVATMQQQAPLSFETMLEMFPVREAFSGYDLALGRRLEDVDGGAAAVAPPSVDIVISRCKSPLQWLWELDYPPRARLFVYDKCRNDPAEFAEQTAGLRGVLEAVEHRPMQEAAGSHLMTGECTAYLTHVIAMHRAGSLADFTVFSHDDGPRHIRLSLLSLALRGMRNSAYAVPFLHLSHERYPSFRTRCLRDVYRQVFSEELGGALGTYCCAHFVVRRDRIEARSIEFFENLYRLITEAPYAQQNGGLCNVGKKPCYVIEFLWHRIFGEEDDLPPRSLQRDLPLALRYEGGRETRLPSPLKVAPYMALFQPSRYSRELERSR
mmetsp:Transcript_119002/g.379515  ORF Transcript_119002/g.379515 Transcript_119002/m.379515 type:complete len:522 (+) Transcript_119002:175-1740(+)